MKRALKRGWVLLLSLALLLAVPLPTSASGELKLVSMRVVQEPTRKQQKRFKK